MAHSSDSSGSSVPSTGKISNWPVRGLRQQRAVNARIDELSARLDAMQRFLEPDLISDIKVIVSNEVRLCLASVDCRLTVKHDPSPAPTGFCDSFASPSSDVLVDAAICPSDYSLLEPKLVTPRKFSDVKKSIRFFEDLSLPAPSLPRHGESISEDPCPLAFEEPPEIAGHEQAQQLLSEPTLLRSISELEILAREISEFSDFDDDNAFVPSDASSSSGVSSDNQGRSLRTSTIP